MHKKVKTNDMLQLRGPYKSLTHDRCISCMGSGESIDHLLLHCPTTLGLWHKLFNLAMMDWVPPKNICDMITISYKGLGSSVGGNTIWKITCLTVPWILWRDRYVVGFTFKSIPPFEPLVPMHLKALHLMLFNSIGFRFVIQKVWTTIRGALFKVVVYSSVD